MLEVRALGILFFQLGSIDDEEAYPLPYLGGGKSTSFSLKKGFKHIGNQRLQLREILRHIFRFAAKKRASSQATATRVHPELIIGIAPMHPANPA